MQGRDVVCVVVPELHHFFANEGNVEITSAPAIRIVRSAVFIALVCHYAAPESNAGALWQSGLKPRAKLSKSERVPIECQFSNPVLDLCVGHIVNAFSTHVRFLAPSLRKKILNVCYNATTRSQSSEDISVENLEPVHIRLATIDDIPALRQLIDDSVRGLSVTHYSARQIESALQDIFGVDTQLILDETYFVAELDGQIVGAGGWSKRTTLFGGDGAKSGCVDSLLDPARQPARIRAFYIHPQWSRRGIGSMILDACEQAARIGGFKTVELASTLPGVPFYLSRGYEKADAIPIPMESGETLITYRMTRRL